MILLSWLYVTYGSLTQVNGALFVLKPAVLGIIATGIIKLGRASIKSPLLAALLVAAIFGMRFLEINFLIILLAAGLLHNRTHRVYFPLENIAGRPVLRITAPPV